MYNITPFFTSLFARIYNPDIIKMKDKMNFTNNQNEIIFINNRSISKLPKHERNGFRSFDGELHIKISNQTCQYETLLDRFYNLVRCMTEFECYELSKFTVSEPVTMAKDDKTIVIRIDVFIRIRRK